MREYDPSEINEDAIEPVRGSLLAWLIRMVRLNRWTTGWGLVSEKGSAGGVISLDPNILPEPHAPQWRGKVTASSSASEDHTIEEVDANDDVLAGGRKTTIGKAHNGRKGVPYDTILMVEESGYQDSDGKTLCFFDIPDGLTDNPKQLKGSGDTADTTTWDVETDGQPVTADMTRYYYAEPTFSMFWREAVYDASGFCTNISAETKYVIEANEDDSSLNGHIALIPAAVGDGAFIALNQPQDDLHTLIFEAGTNITLTENGGGSVSTVEVEVDDSGRLLLAKGGGDQTINISAVAGAGDGQGYEVIRHNNAAVDAETDGGVIDFDDSATTSADEYAVEWEMDGGQDAVAGGANDGLRTRVRGKVDLSALDTSSNADVSNSLVFHDWITVDSGTATNTSITLSSEDWRGRNVRLYMQNFSGTVAAANSTGAWSPASTAWDHEVVGSTHASKVSIFSDGPLNIYIDGTDTGKLKAENITSPGTDSQHMVLAIGSQQKTTTGTGMTIT